MPLNHSTMYPFTLPNDPLAVYLMTDETVVRDYVDKDLPKGMAPYIYTPKAADILPVWALEDPPAVYLRDTVDTGTLAKLILALLTPA